MTAVSRTDRQRARILARLQSHGTTHAGEWKDGGRAVDGGDEITRVAARIEELQKPRHGGHRIRRDGRTAGRLQIYRLIDVAHMPTAKRLPHRPFQTGWLCLNPECLTGWPADYTGECCGDERVLIRLTIRPPEAAERTLEAA